MTDTLVKVKWAAISDPEAYVISVLTSEADDIPGEKIRQARWVLDTLPVADIEVNGAMATNHRNDPLHLRRRDDFVASIRAGGEIKPLVVLGKELLLVDGYARYAALKELRVESVRVRQRIVKKR